MTDRLERLYAIHRKLDLEVAAEAARVLPNRLRVAQLKKMKLVLRDRIEAERTRGAPVPA